MVSEFEADIKISVKSAKLLLDTEERMLLFTDEIFKNFWRTLSPDLGRLFVSKYVAKSFKHSAELLRP